MGAQHMQHSENQLGHLGNAHNSNRSHEHTLHVHSSPPASSICLALCTALRVQDSWTSTMEILTAATNLAYASGPGYWNDLDILTVGMGAQTMDEYISHFQLWCIASSPLIAGNDIRTMSDEVRAVLTHKGAIAINQDKLAVGGNMIRRSIDGSYEIWAKPLWMDNNSSQASERLTRPTQGRATRRQPHHMQAMSLRAGSSPSMLAHSFSSFSPPQPDFRPLPLHAVVLLNRLSTGQDVFVDFDDLFDNKLSPHVDRPPFEAEVSDVWTGQQLGSYTSSFTAKAVRGHASRMITIRCTNC